MSALTATRSEEAFRPRRRLQVPWDWIAVGASLVAAVCVASVGALVLLGRGPTPLGTSFDGRGLDILAFSFLLGAGPYAMMHWDSRRRRLALDARLPDLLTDLASLHKAGLTLHDSLLTASNGDYGPLGTEVKHAADQVRWGIPVLTVLENLSKRLSTPVSERTLAVVLEAARMGGNVPEVLEVAAANARTIVGLREQRARTMGMYTIITYVASVIFIGVALALQAVFVPKMLDAFTGLAAGGASLATSTPTSEEFRNLFYTAALVQAVGNGLVGGLLSDGSVLGGLRHSVAMVLLCFLGFLLF